jgi:hypothetical protein
MSYFKLTSADLEIEYLYGNLFEQEVHTVWSVDKAAPDNNQIRFLLKVLRYWPGPFGVLYVLVASRRGHHHARYQSKGVRNYQYLEFFLSKYHDFFEQDGRHHLWVIDVSSDNRVIYDNHDIINIYGDERESIEICRSHGLVNGPILIPFPHTHLFNSQYDQFEDMIFENYEWLEFPLALEHDDP